MSRKDFLTYVFSLAVTAAQKKIQIMSFYSRYGTMKHGVYIVGPDFKGPYTEAFALKSPGYGHDDCRFTATAGRSGQ